MLRLINIDILFIDFFYILFTNNEETFSDSFESGSGHLCRAIQPGEPCEEDNA